MEFQRIVESVDSEEEDTDLETLRLAALRSRNQKKHSSSYREVVKVSRGEDFRFVSQVPQQRSVVQVSSHCEVWSSDQESSTTDYEDIELSDTNEKNDDTVEICDDIEDNNSNAPSNISFRDDNLHSTENNEVSVGDDFDMDNDDKNSDYGYVDIVFEHNNSDEYDTVKVDDENDNVDEAESFEVSEVVESEVSDIEHEQDLDDVNVREENDLLDSEEDLVDNITITIQNDSVAVGCHDNSKSNQYLLEETEQKMSISEGQKENVEKEEEQPVENVSRDERKQEDQKDEIVVENSEGKKKESEANRKEAKEEENKMKEKVSNSEKESDGSNTESSSSSDSESEPESSSSTTSSSDSQSDGLGGKPLKSKVVHEPQDKHVNDNDQVLKASKEVAKKKESSELQKSQTNDDQADDDRISIGGGASGRDSDFDDDDEPIVKSAVRMRRFYSDSRSKSNLSPPSAERVSKQHRSRSHFWRDYSQSHRNHSQSRRDRSPLRKDHLYSHRDRSRSRERSRGRNQLQNWSHERWRRSRSREQVSYRSRPSDREYRHARGDRRDDVSSRSNNRNLDRRSRSRSRGRKDAEKLDSKSAKPQQRLSSKEIKEKEDTKRLNSVAKPKSVEEKKQKSNGRKAENVRSRETSRLPGSVKKDDSVPSQNKRHERHDQGMTVVSRHTSRKDLLEGHSKKKVEKGDLRERLKLGKPADPGSAAVSTTVKSEPKTVVKMCDSKPDLIIVKKFKTETKPPESREKDLDVKIAKIKHQNELIMRRQREVEADRRKYFT